MARSKFQHPEDATLLALSMLPPATRWEKRAQMISFAAYNVLLDKAVGEDPWPYVIGAAKAHDARSGLWIDGPKARKSLIVPPLGSFEHTLQLAQYALSKVGTGAFAKDRVAKDRYAKSKK